MVMVEYLINLTQYKIQIMMPALPDGKLQILIKKFCNLLIG